MIRKRMAVALMVLMLPAPGLAWAADEPSRADQVRAQAEQAVAVQADIQKLKERFHDRQSRLLDRIEDLELELKDAARQRRKTEAYLADQRSKVSELERRLAESQKIGRDLAPALDRALDRLNQPGSEAPPKLAFGRAELAGLGRLLDDYDAPLSRKTGRLLEVLKQQARLGGRVVVEERDLTIGPGSWRVKLIRLGRLALFALTLDERRAWRYRPGSGQFEPLDSSAPQLARLAEMAQGQRLVELIEVPLGRRPIEVKPGSDK